MDEKKGQKKEPHCEECRRDLGLGVDAVGLQHGVMGPRGFVVLDDPKFFCDEDCLERWLTDEEVIPLKRRIP